MAFDFDSPGTKSADSEHSSVGDNRREPWFLATGVAEIQTLRSPFVRMAAQILNISAHGILVNVAGEAVVPAGTDVAVRIGTSDALGTVRHTSRVHGGVLLGIWFLHVSSAESAGHRLPD